MSVKARDLLKLHTPKKGQGLVVQTKYFDKYNTKRWVLTILDELINKGANDLLIRTKSHYSKNTTKHRDSLEFEILEQILPKTIDEYIFSNHLIELVQEFELYLGNVIKELLTVRPEIVKEQKLSIKELEMLKYDRDLILNAVIDSKVNNLLYKEYKSIFRYINEIGIKHDINDDFIDGLNYIKAIRNNFVHNDGKINKILNEKLKTIHPIGDKIILDKEVLAEIDGYIGSIMLQIDLAISDDSVLYLAMLTEESKLDWICDDYGRDEFSLQKLVAEALEYDISEERVKIYLNEQLKKEIINKLPNGNFKAF